MRRHIRKDHSLGHMTPEDWGLNSYDGAEAAAQILSTRMQADLRLLEAAVGEGEKTIPDAALETLHAFERACRDKDVRDYGATDLLTRTAAVSIIEEYVDARYAHELEPFWENG